MKEEVMTDSKVLPQQSPKETEPLPPKPYAQKPASELRIKPETSHMYEF